jgi:hypothetical protein
MEPEEIQEPRLWRRGEWTAKVVRNDDGEGWAVEMTRAGATEPSLVGPWTMGRDKVNPKPLDAGAFATLVKGASEIMRRHAAAAAERLHRTSSFELAIRDGETRRVRVSLDIAQDDDDPHAILAIVDETTGDTLRSGRVSPAFKITAATAARFLRTGE